MTLHVGTSGWQYRDWRGVLYEDGVPQRAWLARYAREFATVEVNNAFYRLPDRSIFTRWRDETPSGFVMAVKVSRYLTHVRRLRGPEEPVGRLLDRAAGLDDRLGPLGWRSSLATRAGGPRRCGPCWRPAGPRCAGRTARGGP